MRKELYYLILLLILFASCEEKYTPEIDTADGQLVVDAKITNDPTKNFVHLTQTRNFNDNVPLIAVSGAKVELIDKQNVKIQSIENSSGYYVFNSVPVSGISYFIRIGIKNDCSSNTLAIYGFTPPGCFKGSIPLTERTVKEEIR